jgi:hypothetical protein
MLPFYLRASLQPHGEDIRLFGYSYRRVLRGELRAGYEDARRGRAPRPFLETTARGLDSVRESDTLSVP